MESAAINVIALRKRYGSVEALRGVDLEVERGQIFGLLGPNGAGKSTLIRLLIGATRPSGGSIHVLGYDPGRERRPLRRQIGYMPQEPALYEDLSARENVRFFARAHALGDVGRRVEEVLTFVGLQTGAERPVQTFSGGMKQRVSLACALVHRPQMLLLDEPTSGIDPQLRQAFWEHFRTLAATGVTIVVSTHQLDEALHCDRLAVIQQGRVLAVDAPRHLLHAGQATVRIWQHGGPGQTAELSDYPQRLPQLLRQYGLATDIERIEVEEETLEQAVLRLIDQHSAPNGAGGAQ